MLIAHRGLHRRDPAMENTLSAFRAAVDLGVAVEFDVRACRDGVLVVNHDPAAHGAVLADIAFEELSARLGERCPPTLDAVMATVGGHVAVDVELKERDTTDAALDIIAHHAPPDSVSVTSFLWDVAGGAKARRPDFQCGLLVGQFLWDGEQPMRDFADALFAEVSARGCDFLAPHHQLVESGMLEHAGECGVPLVPWTVNDIDLARVWLGDARIRHVISDNADLL